LESEQPLDPQKREFSLEGIKASLISHPGKTITQGKESLLPKAAVAIILNPDKLSRELLMLFVKRKSRDSDPWSGHMAFPGGRFTDSDTSLLETAIREVREEINVDLREMSFLGTLDEIVARTMPIRVTPFVFQAKDVFRIVVSPEEIDTFTWIPLSFFRDRKNMATYTIVGSGQNDKVPSYRFMQSQIIWGMTLRIVEDFLQKISLGEKDLSKP
jgi:8-oxo-dGTP pyrophosphatase MutT (NUDIX family)